jgi:hypothetical protein
MSFIETHCDLSFGGELAARSPKHDVRYSNAMFVFVLLGRSVQATPVGERDAICGQCLESTRQIVCSLQERLHAYFVPFGDTVEIGRASVCSVCRAANPLFEQEPRSDEELLVDAFVDIHDRQATRADATPLAFFAGCGSSLAIFVLGLVLSVVLARWIPELAALGLGFVGLLLAYFGFHRARFRVANRRLRASFEPKLTRLFELTGWDREDVMDRAHDHGRSRIRDYLAATLELEDAGPRVF